MGLSVRPRRTEELAALLATFFGGFLLCHFLRFFLSHWASLPEALLILAVLLNFLLSVSV